MPSPMHVLYNQSENLLKLEATILLGM